MHVYSFFLAGHHEQQILYISRDTLHLYNVPWKNSTRISKHLQHLIEVDYDFETQTIFYIIDSYKINQTNLITKEVQVKKILYSFIIDEQIILFSSQQFYVYICVCVCVCVCVRVVCI